MFCIKSHKSLNNGWNSSDEITLGVWPNSLILKIMALAVIQIWTQVCLQSIKKDNDVIFNFLTVHDLDIWRLNLNYMDNLVFIQSWMLRILKLDLWTSWFLLLDFPCDSWLLINPETTSKLSKNHVLFECCAIIIHFKILNTFLESEEDLDWRPVQ